MFFHLRFVHGGITDLTRIVEFYDRQWKSYDDFDIEFKEFCACTKQVFTATDTRLMAYQNAKLCKGMDKQLVHQCVKVK